MNARNNISIVILSLVAIAGWYGSYAGYALGYNQGSKDLNQAATNTSYAKGYEQGKRDTYVTVKEQVEEQVREQVRTRGMEMERSYEQDIQRHSEQAFQQGAAAYAKRITDNALKFTIGVPNKK